MWVDAHLHLDAPVFDLDRDAVIARAVASGVGLMIAAGTSIEGSRRVLELARRYPQVAAAVGIHPAAADEATPGGLEALAALARDPRVCAIGEVGLDYYRAQVPRATQIEAFRAQIRLARQIDLALVVHDRDAHPDVDGLLAEEGAGRVILHCFTGSAERAQRCAAAGWMLSFAGILTFPKSGDLREAARDVPIDRVLVETDAPYLAPVPHRGGRCEPAYVVDTARTLAELRGMNLETLAVQVAANAAHAFSLTEPLARRP
jgi:TatD DNase family protein